MLHANGKQTCDKEVGSVKNGWHVCNKPAYHKVQSNKVSWLTLHFCNKHVNSYK